MNEDLKYLLDGDMSHFDSFYEKTKRSVFCNIFAILKDYSLSEDVLQETYLKFLNNLPKLRHESNILGYLFVISRNIALDVIKKKKRECSLEPFENNLNVTKNHENDVITKAKEILKDEEFEIVILHVVNELTHKEIAKLKHKPLGTITWAYNNAIKKLKKGLEDYGK